MSEKREPNLKKLLIDESKTICPQKVTHDKKTYNDYNAFIFSMHMKINKKSDNCKKKYTQWRYSEEGLKKNEATLCYSQIH